jgi:hypothetical protein
MVNNDYLDLLKYLLEKGFEVKFHSKYDPPTDVILGQNCTAHISFHRDSNKDRHIDINYYKRSINSKEYVEKGLIIYDTAGNIEKDFDYTKKNPNFMLSAGELEILEKLKTSITCYLKPNTYKFLVE